MISVLLRDLLQNDCTYIQWCISKKNEVWDRHGYFLTSESCQITQMSMSNEGHTEAHSDEHRGCCLFR